MLVDQPHQLRIVFGDGAENLAFVARDFLTEIICRRSAGTHGFPIRLSLSRAVSAVGDQDHRLLPLEILQETGNGLPVLDVFVNDRVTGIQEALEILSDFPFRTPQEIGLLDYLFYRFSDFRHLLFRNGFGEYADSGKATRYQGSFWGSIAAHEASRDGSKSGTSR